MTANFSKAKILSQYLTVFKNDADAIVGGIVTRDGKGMEIDTATTAECVEEKRFFGDCKCRPVLNETAGFVQIAGEDDCPTHGFQETGDDDVEF